MKFDATIIFLLATVITLIIERVFYYKSRYGNKKKNPTSNFVSLPRFHQEFKDFKDQQKEWNEKMESNIEELDNRLDKLEKGRK